MDFLESELLIALMVFGAVVAVVLAFFMNAAERSEVRSALERLDDYEVYIESERDKVLSKSLAERLTDPAKNAFAALMRRFTPAGYIENTRRKLTVAGKPGNDALDRFLAVQVVFAILGLIAIPIVPQFIEGGKGILATLLIVAVCFLGPASQLNKKMSTRQMEIRTALPDMLDLLTISVEAGLGFEQALDRTVNSVPGELSNEFARMLAETRAGASRADALRALEKRTDTPEVRSFVLAILQADTFGVSIARVLRVQAEEMRIKRRQLAQEKAQKAPVKMLIPMVFCIFPSVFVVILGPAIINISKSFSGS